MGFTKKFDLAVKTGTYRDGSGSYKGRYENVGMIMEDDKGDQFIVLKRTFNPAGVPNPDNKDSCIVSIFEPRQRQQHGSGGGGGQQPAQQPRQQPRQQGDGHFNDFEDDIPF